MLSHLFKSFLLLKKEEGHFCYCFPLNLLIQVCRGPFGCWVAFLAVAANLFWPESFPGLNLVLTITTEFLHLNVALILQSSALIYVLYICLSASRFLLFVITPDWLADGLRDSIFSGVVCLVVGVSLLITELGGIRRFGSCQWNFHCIASCLGIAFLFFFTIRYLCLGTW